MPRIDSHQHFWIYDPPQYPWIQESWPLRRDFLPPHLGPLLIQAGFDGCVAVQARQSLEETRWLLTLAEKFPFIQAVVGWVELLSPEVDRQLDAFSGNAKLKGVRHVLQDEPNDRFMLRADFQRGIGALARWDLAYDILIFPKQLPAAIELTRKFPEQRFVLDHMAKPAIASRDFAQWSQDIAELARRDHVFCKISGLVTEAAWRKWQAADFRHCLDVVWTAFGEDRLMIGSDWPVCLLSAEYSDTIRIASEYFSQFSGSTREKIFGGNATRFYQLTGKT